MNTAHDNRNFDHRRHYWCRKIAQLWYRRHDANLPYSAACIRAQIREAIRNIRLLEQGTSEAAG